MKSNLLKTSFLYKILFKYVKLGHRLFYRKINVLGKENLNLLKPTILAPSHQNGLMDALAVLFVTNQPVAFLARADIFKNERVAKLLRTFKIVPVYRLRDGVESLSKNEGIFDKTVEVINHPMPLCLFPEANHKGEKRIRTIKKGIARIAFNNHINSNLQIIPIGIDYSDYFDGYSDLLVNYGQPLLINDFKNYDSEQKEMRRFMISVEEGMRDQVIDVPEQNYHTIFTAIKLIAKKEHKTSKVEQFLREQELAKDSKNWDFSSQTFNKLKQAVHHYDELTNQQLTVSNHFSLKNFLLTSVFILIFLPLFPFGFLLNFIPYKISRKLATKTTDPHLQVSIQFVLYLFLFPIFYLLIGVILSIIMQSFIWLFTTPILGVSTLFYQKKLERLYRKIKFIIKTNRNKDYRDKIANSETLIDSLVEELQEQRRKK